MIGANASLALFILMIYFLLPIAHILELLLQRGHEVVTTVRSEDKASKIRSAHPDAKLSVVIVPDIAQPDAFDEVVKTSGLEVVLHSKSMTSAEYLVKKRSRLMVVNSGISFPLQVV